MAFPPHHVAYEATKIVARQSSATDGAGSARALQQSSASQVLSTIGPVAAYSFGFFILFLFLRRMYPRIYMPRTFVRSLPDQERTKALPTGFANWFRAFFDSENVQVLNAQETLDGFLFLRLLRKAVTSCLVGCLITWPLLIPINATGVANQTQLNILTFSNVAAPTHPNSYNRYYAHVLCAWIFFGYIIYLITQESLYLINLRQAYLLSPVYANRISSRTVLFCSIPRDYLNPTALRNLFGRDIVRNIWIPLNTDKLEEMVTERDDLLMKLENAEVDLIRRANQARSKALKKGQISATEDKQDTESDESGSVAARWIKSSDRPTHRTGFWGLWGTKVDTINWCREQLTIKIPEVHKMQYEQRNFKGKTRRAAFVEFNNLNEAQNAFQDLTHHLPLHMSPRYTGVHPEEIIWYNLRLRWWERILRTIGSYSTVIAVIILWSFPIAFVGSISKLKYLSSLPALHWLGFINHLGYFTGIITGLLPVILLSVLMALLPIFLRLMARLAGDPTESSVEYTVQSTYFWFYVIQGFLVTTLSSSAVQAAATIFKNPASVVNLLANSLPEASNFYLSFFVLQGLGVVSQILLSLVGLLLYILLGKLLDNTPRKLFERWIDLSQPSLGTFYPIYTTFFVMAISYACIAPLVIGFATIGLTLFYLAFRYQFLFVYNVKADTKGLMYGRALQQLFVGLYVAEGCLIGLFAINLGNSSKLLGPLILMIIFLVFTGLYHYSLNSALSPLLNYLPKTLEKEERRLLEEEEEEEEGEDATNIDMEDIATGKESNERNGSLTSQIGVSPSAGSPVSSSAAAAKKRTANKPVEKKQSKSNFFQKLFKPARHENYYKLRQMVPREQFHIDYTDEEEKKAYYHPYVTKEPEVLWIPRDEAGVSRQEVRDTSKVTPISDEAAILSEKGKIEWDHDKIDTAPIHRPRIYY